MKSLFDKVTELDADVHKRALARGYTGGERPYWLMRYPSGRVRVVHQDDSEREGSAGTCVIEPGHSDEQIIRLLEAYYRNDDLSELFHPDDREQPQPGGCSK